MTLNIRLYFNAILFASLLVIASDTPHSFAQKTYFNEQGESVKNISLEQLQKMAIELSYYDEILIKQKDIQGLRAINEDAVFPSSLYLYSNKNKKNSSAPHHQRFRLYETSNLMNSNNDWVSSRNQTSNSSSKSGYGLTELFWLVLGVVGGLVC